MQDAGLGILRPGVYGYSEDESLSRCTIYLSMQTRSARKTLAYRSVQFALVCKPKDPLGTNISLYEGVISIGLRSYGVSWCTF